MAHNHNISDSDVCFSIDPISREIKNKTLKTTLIQFDKKSERFGFELPRILEGHDMSLCSKVEIHYINVSHDGKNQSEDVYPVEDLTINAVDDSVVMFSWLVSGNATKYEGTLIFLVKFRCLTGATIDYEWNTDIFEGISVGKGMDNGEAVVAKYSDVLEAWKNDILSAFDAEFDIVQNTGNSKAKVMSQKAVTDAIAVTETKISRNDKRITNLEQGIIPDPFATDDSVAYTKDVPTNALPYAEITKVGGMTYKDGDTLKSAKVTEIASVGKNLCPVASITTKESPGGHVDIYGVAKHGYYTASAYITKYADDTSTNTRLSISVHYTDGTTKEVGCTPDPSSAESDGIARRKTATVQTDSSKTISRIRITTLNYSTANNRNAKAENIQFEYGNVATEYEPYNGYTLPIPQAVQDLDGYGLGISATYHNYVDWENKRFVQRVGKFVLTGSEPLEFYNNRFKLLGFAKTGVHPPVICVSNKYVYEPTVTSDGATKTGVLVDGDILCIRDMDYTSLASFKAYLVEQYANGTPVTIVYALAEPIETDITDLLTADNFIEVEGGGTITMVNDYGYDVPSEITYMLKGEAV